MAYSDFKKLECIIDQFSVSVHSQYSLFKKIDPLSITDTFAQQLKDNVSLALNINTEKARSEFIIAPVLLELRKIVNKNMGLFSGFEFNVDVKQGLNGYCDFILTKSPNQILLEAPVICLVEAKNENIKSGLAQCSAEMIAAHYFNLSHQDSLETILGVVTTGSNWKFLILQNNQIEIDFDEYLISDIDKILAILVYFMQC